MPLFRRKRDRQLDEREIPEPDWDRIRDRLASDEREVDACKGWTVGGTIDNPCAVYLTNRAIYVDIRPDTLARPETIVIPLETVDKCAVGRSDVGSPRLVVVSDPVGNSNPADVLAVGVDLRPESMGWSFGETVTTAVEVARLQLSYAYLNANLAPLPTEAEEMASIEHSLAELGAAPDPALNARIKRELGVPDTPFNS